MKDLDRPFVVDYVICHCNGCQKERKVTIDPPWTRAQQFIDWHKAGAAGPCQCGAATFDAKLHIAEVN